jgi:hypothetical protein
MYIAHVYVNYTHTCVCTLHTRVYVHYTHVYVHYTHMCMYTTQTHVYIHYIKEGEHLSA